MNLINTPAPDFTAAAVLPDGSIENAFRLQDVIRDRYAVLFFYPLDFTFVCPTELLAFHHRVADFGQRDTAVIGVSIDSQYTHLAWRVTPTDQGASVSSPTRWWPIRPIASSAPTACRPPAVTSPCARPSSSTGKA